VIPWSFAWRAGSAVAAAAAIAFAGWWVMDSIKEWGRVLGRAEVQARWDSAVARQRKADEAEEADRLAKLKEITDAAKAQAARDRAAVDRARAAGNELQRAFAGALKRCQDSAAAQGSPPAAGTGDLLADVSRRVDAAAGELAAVAQERGRAGLACERSYDSLSP
jgi:hypothetical protein